MHEQFDSAEEDYAGKKALEEMDKTEWKEGREIRLYKVLNLVRGLERLSDNFDVLKVYYPSGEKAAKVFLKAWQDILEILKKEFGIVNFSGQDKDGNKIDLTQDVTGAALDRLRSIVENLPEFNFDKDKKYE